MRADRGAHAGFAFVPTMRVGGLRLHGLRATRVGAFD